MLNFDNDLVLMAVRLGRASTVVLRGLLKSVPGPRFRKLVEAELARREALES